MPNKYHRQKYNDSEMNYDESHFSKVAFVAGATILGIAGYKSGMFKKSADAMIKYASKHSTNTVSALDAFRKWSNMTTSQFAEMSGKNGIGDITKSIRNNQGYKKLKFKDLRKQSTRQNFYSNLEHNANQFFNKERIAETKEDFKLLGRMIKENKIDYSSIKDTELYRNKIDINNTIRRLTKDGWNDKQIKSAEKKMYSDYINKLKQMTEEANEQMKRTGNRNLTIGDLYDYADKNGKKGLSSVNNKVSFTVDDKDTTAEKFLDDLYAKVKEHKLISDDDFKKLTIDTSLLIDGDNNISDIRGFKKTYNTLIDSLANDFKVPVIGINPLKMFGIGNSDGVYNFGALAKGSIQNIIKNKSGKEAALDGALFFSNGSVFDVDELGNLTKIKDNMKIHRVRKNANTVDKTLEGVRKMSGINKNTYIKYTKEEDGVFKSSYGKMAEFLDIGFSDISPYELNELGVNEFLNPNTYISKLTNNIGNNRHVRPHKGVNTKDNYTGVFSTVGKFDDELFIAVNKSVTLDDVLKVGDSPYIPKVDKDSLNRYIKQYFANRSNLEDVTERTTTLFYSADRVNNLLGSVGLGLSTESTTSAGGILKNMLLKRALPAYLGYSTYQSIVALTENEDEDGKVSNIQKTMVTGVAKTDLLLHKVKDVTLLTSAFKEIDNLMPGFDQILELPGISALKLTNTYDEQLEYLESGMDPIRKGRFWDSGSTAFTGSKINYYKPSYYRRAMAEVEFSDSQYGSRMEWLQNQPLPSIASPLSPLRYFIGDRYHWEEKHYNDRPYMETSPMFQNIPIIGGPLSATIGSIIKPTKRMHEEYWNNDNINYTFGGESNTIPGITNTIASNAPINNSMFRKSNVNSMIPVLYSTKSGGSSVVGLDGTNISGINYQLMSGNSLNKVTGNSIIKPVYGTTEAEMITADMLASQDGLGFNTGEFYNSMNDFLGMHGFMTASVFGDANEDGMYIENSSYAYSHSRAFWNTEIGGLGGTINEVTRRFLRQRLKDDQLYNPIRNTMACLLPNTDVLAYNGLCVKANTINVGDDLMSKDGKKVTVTAIKKYDANEIITINLYGDNYHNNDFSWNHPIYMSNHVFKNAIDVEAGEYVSFPIVKYNQLKDRLVDVSDYISNGDFHITDKYIYYGVNSNNAIETEICESFNYKIDSIPIELKKKYRKIYDICKYNAAIDDQKKSIKRINRYWSQNDLYYLIGVYSAEGSECNKNKSIKISGHVDDKWEHEICRIFDTYCVKFSKQKAKIGTGQNLIATCPPLNYILKNVCPGHARTKCIKECIYNDVDFVCENSILKLIKGVIDGDGCSIHTKDNRIKIGFTSTSYNLAYQIRNMIINSTGVCPAFTREKTKFGDVYHVYSNGELANFIGDKLGIDYNRHEYKHKQNNQHQYHDDTHIYIKVKNVTIKNEKCEVIGYCVTGDHTFCTANIATHNTWLPGSDYFLDLKHGDAYVKVPWGEGRLPGEGYERLWDIKPFELGIGSSFLGKSKDDMIRHFLHQDDITDSYIQNIVDTGTRFHERVEKAIINSGYAIDTERTIYNEKYRISGTYDIRLRDNSTVYGQSIMDIKTIGDKGFNEILKTGMKDEHKSQVNFYLNELGLDKGYVMYINRDNPEQMHTYSMEYDRGLFVDTIQKLESARHEVLNKVDTGEISRGDLYKPIDRLRILGDVAPYSKEYEDMNSYVSQLTLSEKEKKEVRGIRDRVTQQRNPKRLYEYKFKDIETMYETAMVDTLFDDGTFTVKGSDKKFKLAGIDIEREEDPYREDKRIDYMNDMLGPGNIIGLEFDINPENRTKGTTTRVIAHSNAVDGFANINRELLSKGYAKENESDNGIDLKVKMNGLERATGRFLETLTHMDTPFNTKFMKVRTAKEDYERSRVYGNSDFGLWSSPIRDYYKPLVLDRNIGRGTISGLIMGAVVGKMFGSNKFGAIVGATTTTAMVLGGKLYAGGYKAVTGSTWKPERVRKEQELNEYIDTLKYVKYKKLYEEYKQKAKSGLNGIDVDKLIEREKIIGYWNKGRENETNKFAMNVKKAEKKGRSIRDTAMFGPSTDEYSLGGLMLKRIQDGLNFKDFLSSSIKNKMEYEYARKTEDYSNVNNRDADGKSLNFFDYSLAKEQYDEDAREQDIKDAKKSIAKERKRLKGAKRVIGITGSGDYASANSENIIVDRITNLAALRNMLDSNNKTYIDEDIKLSLEGTGLNPIYKKNGDINREKLLSDTNDAINNLSVGLGINEDAVMALMYYKLSEQTMYAYDSGDPITDLLKSMPKRDRDYFNHFVKASEQDKLKILDMVPKYMRRPLQSAWGLTVEQKTNINDYFNNRPLPEADWEGWREDVDLDAVKVKMIKRENMEFKDNNIWKDDIKKANSVDIKIPKLESKTMSGRSTLKKLLTRNGFIDVQIHDAGQDTTSNTQLYLTHDEKKRYKEELGRKINENFI